MGLTLFTIYTIELSWILKKHNVTFKLYADDSFISQLPPFRALRVR